MATLGDLGYGAELDELFDAAMEIIGAENGSPELERAAERYRDASRAFGGTVISDGDKLYVGKALKPKR